MALPGVPIELECDTPSREPGYLGDVRSCPLDGVREHGQAGTEVVWGGSLRVAASPRHLPWAALLSSINRGLERRMGEAREIVERFYS